MAKELYGERSKIGSRYTRVRRMTEDLFRPLRVEDAVIQSDAFGSPPNWHIAHVTWFFQKVLEKNGLSIGDKGEREELNLAYLNSYYQKYGEILSKSERGQFPRPTVDQTLAYRKFVDDKMLDWIGQMSSRATLAKDIVYDIDLGIQHEMQHQELMLYDLQHYFQRFPDPQDNYGPTTIRPAPKKTDKLTGTVEIPGGIFELGFSGEGFCYDNELPKHKVHLQSFRMNIAPVTNGDFMKFMADSGYDNYRYWFADGWDLLQEKGWKAPLYWERKEDRWVRKDFRGLNEIDPEEPVSNVSYYEADAYAKWSGKRLPTEAEWEKAASWNERLQRKTLYPWGDDSPTPRRANLLESYIWAPAKVGSYPDGRSFYGCHQMIGDIWEWTSSEYVLYPGFKSRFDEYTDKWAVGQKVLRGGCFATPQEQIRNSYRNYFKPHERIPFAGFRCAQDAQA